MVDVESLDGAHGTSRSLQVQSDKSPQRGREWVYIERLIGRLVYFQTRLSRSEPIPAKRFGGTNRKLGRSRDTTVLELYDITLISRSWGVRGVLLIASGRVLDIFPA